VGVAVYEGTSACGPRSPVKIFRGYKTELDAIQRLSKTMTLKKLEEWHFAVCVALDLMKETNHDSITT
jgi:hypothetical protein